MWKLNEINLKWKYKIFLYSVYYIVLVDFIVNTNGLTGDYVCTEHQKYNITKRIKYRAPMAVKTYEWCLAVPPRCSKWITEMRDTTRLETEERSAEVAICCPGFKLKGNTCAPKCPHGRKGSLCDEVCESNRWGPSCVRQCHCPVNAFCSPLSGVCFCRSGWLGEKCDIEESSTAATTTTVSTTTTTAATTTQIPITSTLPPTTTNYIDNVNFSNTDINITSRNINKNNMTNFYYDVFNKHNNNTKNDAVTIEPNMNRTQKDNNYKQIFLEPTTNEELNVFTETATTKGEIFEDRTSMYNVRLETNKVTTPKTIIVSIIPNQSNTTVIPFKKIEFHDTRQNKTTKHDNRKKNVSVSTTSPIYHIIRIPPKDYRSNTLHGNHTTITFINNASLESLLTTIPAYTLSHKKRTPETNEYDDNTELTTLPAKHAANEIFLITNQSDYSIEYAKKVYAKFREDFNKQTNDSSNTSQTLIFNVTHPPDVNNIEMKHIEDTVRYLMNTSAFNIELTDASANRGEHNPYDSVDKLEDEFIHVLTEPEHITAVADENIPYSSRDNLSSIIAIVASVSVLIISIAIFLVMYERWKQQHFDDIERINDIVIGLKKVQLDEPQYLSKSIFHTPLPAIPNEQYEPISNLDKNLKQFMKPVLIEKPPSPCLLDNFRDIIECHYDHIPFRVTPIKKSLEETPSKAPSSVTNDDYDTLNETDSDLRNDMTISDEIELKKIDDFELNSIDYACIDNENSNEPIYDEIPFEKLIEISPMHLTININGESVTEL